MGRMKEEYMAMVSRELYDISNGMDGEAEVWAAHRINEIYGRLQKVMNDFEFVKTVMAEAEDTFYTGDVYEDACLEDEEFEELFEILEKLENIVR